ncbi:uncharacterized protein LOC126366224 isoform X2 [Pectinophora gossypiella]|uniref:Little elongation complex subunit 2 C-terminal domain-containing protein n=1 Tax=Pectinophora gossypiella TaxID=13191 RepID=A0A1E1VZG9_PECGO|nr:uncharacterized protein LOC126366224 isoform X2 [Pectinophora gossypiella]
MMEHVRQFDWNPSDRDTVFLKEEDMDNSAIERIIRNKFHDPLISSDSEDDKPSPKIDWNDVFKRKEVGEGHCHVYVAGLRKPPPHPKLSALTREEHFKLLKVLCTDYPKVLPVQYIPRPTKHDYNLFEAIKDKYLEEQKEYMEWAKTLWTNSHCGRALRPKPVLERVYEAEYKMKAKQLESFPKSYEMAAHIALHNKNNNCSLTHKKDLINVNYTGLPKTEFTETVPKKFVVIRPGPLPEPCTKHPCWFMLPNENNMTELPLTEIHRELAQYALDNGTQNIVSESALKCLIEIDRHWMIPLSVYPIINADGEKQNVIVFGSEFSAQKKSAMTRTYRGLHHLLETFFIPPAEKAKIFTRMNSTSSTEKQVNATPNGNTSNGTKCGVTNLRESFDDMDVTSDEDEGHLFIDEGEIDTPPCEDKKEPSSPPRVGCVTRSSPQSPSAITTPCQGLDMKTTMKSTGVTVSMVKSVTAKSPVAMKNDKNNSIDDCSDNFYSCTCNAFYTLPPPRSFRKWQVRNFTNNDRIDLIVHCSHKHRNHNSEVLLEPIPEYQLELGGSKQSDQKIKSLALSLLLRKNASLVNVRVDCSSGEVVTIETLTHDEFTKRHGNLTQDISNVVYETINQLQGLLPGNYILQHEPSQGPNAFLFATGVKGSAYKLVLDFNSPTPADADEATSVKSPPVLTPVLLPMHKYRKILPCAFTTDERLVVKEPKKLVNKQKPPPQAIKGDDECGTRRKWPKKTRSRAKRRAANRV